MLRFIELHYKISGDPFLVNVAAISRVYTNKDTGETRVALLEDKNTQELATECSRQAVYRVREDYNAIRAAIAEATGLAT